MIGIEKVSQGCSAPLSTAPSPAAVLLRNDCSANIPNELQVAALWVSNCNTINSMYRSHYSLSGKILRPSHRRTSANTSSAWIYNLILHFCAPEVTSPGLLHTSCAHSWMWLSEKAGGNSPEHQLKTLGCCFSYCFLLIVSKTNKQTKNVSLLHRRGEEPAIKVVKRIIWSCEQRSINKLEICSVTTSQSWGELKTN